MGIKKSLFTALDNIPGDATLDFVSSGTNFKITKADFITEMGATGTLSQLGDVTGTPILNTVGTDNQIRNLEAGSGITTAVSAQLGAEISHNFSAGGEGTEVLVDITADSPKIRGITGTSGITVTASTSGNSVQIAGPGAPLVKRVIVTQASDLAGALDSSVEYFIDGVIDMGSQGIEVPQGGLNLAGYNFDLSRLTSTAGSYTMFTSPVGGSGNLLGKDYAIEVTGAGSQVYNLVSDTGTEAFEFSRINYNNCTSLGTIFNYRQGLEVGTGRFGGQPELTLDGAWIGGFFIDTSIVRNMTDGAFTLFKAGATFTMASRFRSNMNVDLPASASFFDFSASSFLNPSTVEMDGVIITRDGVFDSEDSNLTPNMTAGDLVSKWMGNNGLPNTFVGGAIGVTTETVTTITSSGVFEDLEATLWTAADLQHFDAPTGNRLRHLGNTPREYKVIASFVLDSASGDDIALRVNRFDSSTSTAFEVLTQTREVNSFTGGRNVAFFDININTTLDEGDYIFLEVANVLATNDVTAETDSYYIVEAR